MLEQQIEQDIKTAQLAGETHKLTTLRGIKAVLLNVKVATGKRDSGLTDEEVLQQLTKQVKQRQESAEMYVQGGDQVRADKELEEKAILEAYLPEQLNEEDIAKLIDAAIAETGATGLADMGKVIGKVKGQAGATADGSIIARLTKEKLQ
ncbi:MAG: GatB/YqeY domain-containing protein [Patescibacteria group bacterium]